MRKGGGAIGKMSSSGRKRGSKWDLKEESRIQFENVQGDTWSAKAGMSLHDKELQHDWLSPEAAGSNRHKWSVAEHMPGRKGSRRGDNFDEDHNRSLKSMTTWEEDENYGTRMSPGLDEWRQQSHGHSPINEWKRSRRSRSRSRSRSPVHVLRRESGLYDRSRSKSGVPTQVCKDFAAGGCRRGNHCHFLHQGIVSNEDSWERHRKPAASKYSISHDSREYPVGSGRSADYCTDFLKGNCRKGASCRFAHHGDSKLSGKGSRSEVVRERDDDRRYRGASPDRRGECEPRRAVDIPCKFFAAGNCRNGKYCKFSHHGPARVSPDRRSRDGRWLVGRNSDDVENMQIDHKWSDSNVSSDATKSNEIKIEKMGAPEPRPGARPIEDRWGHNTWENRIHGDPSIDNKAVEINKKDAFQWERGNAGDNMNVSEQKTENWLRDMDMSPEWHYKVKPSNLIDKGDHGSLPSCGPGVTQEAPGKVPEPPAVLSCITKETSSIQQDRNAGDVGFNALQHNDVTLTRKTSSLHMNISGSILGPQGLNQNVLPSSALPIPSLNAVGESQVTMQSDTSRGGRTINPQNQSLFQEAKAMQNADIGNANASQMNLGIPTTQSMVSGEQLTQLSNLLQLYAAQTSQNGIDMSTFANSEGTGKPKSERTSQLNQAVGTEKQYDPICDSIEPDKHFINNPPGFSPNLMSQASNTDGKLEIPAKNLSPLSDAAQKDPIDKSCQLIQQESGPTSEATKENNQVETMESRKAHEENKTAEEKGSSENIDGGDIKADESKKNKDAKGIRAFKFALVEFIKEIMKPTWKEGQMSKDAYKNIVKKVVDKVTSSIGANIPQTQEKIEQYLSTSKPKLTKLVQAYVEKLQKDK